MKEEFWNVNAVIPSCIQICMDDLGWFNSEDDRFQGGPSRTAMCRRHNYMDYEAINYLGERLNMKVNCAFVMGEWDPDNRLSKIPYMSKHPSWDNSRFFKKADAEKCAEVINNSPYIDIAVHGLLHGYYKPGIDNCDTSDWYYRINKELILVPEQEIRDRLDMFFELLEVSGIKKKVNSFIPPSGAYRWGELTRILKDYGIEYSTPVYGHTVYPDDVEVPHLIGIENGIVSIDRYGYRGNGNNLSWYVNNCDMNGKPLCEGIFGCHWPNFLHNDPRHNKDVVDRNIPWFEKNAETFGLVISRDMRFCASHNMFKEFAKVTRKGYDISFDITNMPKSDKVDRKFILSTITEISGSEGCSFKLFEKKKKFYNYEISVNENVENFKVTVKSSR